MEGAKTGEDQRRRAGARRSQDTQPREPGSQEAGRGWYSRGYLPHFDAKDTIQHITYHLADSLPQSALAKMQEECKSLPDNRRKIELRRRIDEYLDAGHGSAILANAPIAKCIVDTWHHFDGERYRLLAWVVMPNHCHVLIETLGTCSLGQILLSWKSYTAKRINRWKRGEERRAGARRSQGRQSQRPSSRVWQRDYWDRYIRDEAHFWTVKAYIENNPVKAKLVAVAQNWPWSSASCAILADI